MNIEYKKLSHKEKLIRNIFFMAFSLFFLFLPESLYNFLSEKTGFEINKFSVILFYIGLFFCMAAFNFYKWRGKKGVAS